MTKKTKGIILAGGSGTRLYPLTAVASKQLQVVYDKPMIYYPLSTLMLVGIRDILIISTPGDLPNFRNLLGDGSQWGIRISYAEQTEPRGIAEAFIIGKEFCCDAEKICLILGDNIFFGKLDFIRRAMTRHESGGMIFAYQMKNPQAYGVVEFNSDGSVAGIEEKPANPKSSYAVPGFYIFDRQCIEIAEKIKPSARGELEITDIQNEYLRLGMLHAAVIGRGIVWFDTGTADALLEAATFIAAIEKRQGRKIACPEEISLIKGFVSTVKYLANISKMPESPYREYCTNVLEEIRKNYL